MQIGIITFHFALSYGAVLQAYALSECLKKLGHEPSIIDYRPDSHTRAYQWKWRYCGLQLSNFLYPIVKRRFNEFSQKHLNLTSRSYRTLEELTADPPIADAYICGSDQVWNPDLTGQDMAYFLPFAREGARRIAYAASFGKSELPLPVIEQMKPYLQKIDSVLVREESGINIVEDTCGKQALHVLDPTLLLENYDSVLTTNRIKKGYLLLKFLQNSLLSRQTADFVSREMHLPKAMLNNYSQKFWQQSGKRLYPGPGGYLSLIKDADFVVTNSFHGTVFSLIFNKPFLITALTGNRAGRNKRITGILKSVDLMYRYLETYCESTIRRIIERPINWEHVNERIHASREESLDFLKRSLS